MKQAAVKVFRSKYFVIPVLFCTLVLAILVYYFATINSLVVYPNKDLYRAEFYTDQANGGNSEVVKFDKTDSLLLLQFKLNDKFHSPYVGISITPENSQYINAKKYNCLNISISGINSDRVGISLFTAPLEVDGEIITDEALYHTYLNISDELKTYTVPIAQLQHPEWWKDVHHLSEAIKNTPDLTKILHINIGSAYSQSIDNLKVIEIHAITFSRNNNKLFLLLGVAYFLIILINFFVLFLPIALKFRKKEVVVSYKSLEYSKSASLDEKCLEYINTHYENSNLTLEVISSATAISPRRITTIIQEKFNCNFKTYLNRIRINESKRFLEQSGLNMGEIAYKVGFNSQSHFNRVFKAELGISPTEYRDQSSSK